MHDLLLIGGGGHCKSVIDVIEQEAKYKIKGIIDLKAKIGERVLDYDVIGSDEDLEKLHTQIKYAFITVGHIYSNEARVTLYQNILQIGFELPTIISPLAYISKHAKVGQGSIAMHYAMVNAGASIGANTILNTRSLVEHDARIGDHCHISTGAIVNGGTEVLSHSFIGSQSTTKEYIHTKGFHKAGKVIK